MSRRINISDFVQGPFYQLPKVLVWNKEFRNGLSSDAKLLYMLLKDRFQLSLNREQHATGGFRDRNGDVYCILDNFEMAFLLNASVKSVIKYMLELVQMGLVEYQESEGGAHKYYLMTLDTYDTDFAQFLGERDYHKHVLQQKKKGKPVRKTEDECVEDQRRMQDKTAKSKVEKMALSRGEESAPPGVETLHPQGEQMTPPGVKPFHPNDNKLKQKEINQSDLPSIFSSSSEKVEASFVTDQLLTKEEEEEAQRMLTYLGQQLVEKKVMRNAQQVNSILQHLWRNGRIQFEEADVAKSIAHYETECLKRGKIYSPVDFFVKGFGMVLDQRHSLGIKSKLREPCPSQETGERSQVVPFYNWLEQDGDDPVILKKGTRSHEEEMEYPAWRKTLSFGA